MNNDFDTRLERAVAQYRSLHYRGPAPAWNPQTRPVLGYALATAAAMAVVVVGWRMSASSPAWPDDLRAQVRASPFEAAGELGRELERTRKHQHPVGFRIPPPPPRAAAFRARPADGTDPVG